MHSRSPQVRQSQQIEMIQEIYELSCILILPIDIVGETLSERIEPLSSALRRDAFVRGGQGYERLVLGFLDDKKVDEISDVDLPFVINATISNHSISGILVDDRSSYNLIYLKIFAQLGIRPKYLKPYIDQSLLAFNDSSTHPY